MSNIRLPLPCPAYTGKEPYIFISYAHVDADWVYPEIKALYEYNYRIWYDEGINPGSEWSEEIARAIIGCAIFIVFISRNAIESRNVKREISFALNENKLLLPIHLEEVSLPPGLKLSLWDIQAIMKWGLSEDDYMRKMLKALPGDCLKGSERVLVPDIPKNIIQVIHMSDSFVFIKEGTYLMGSPKNEAEREKKEIQHQVKVGDFYMAKYPVTVADFEIFINETNYRTDADKDGGSYIWNDCYYQKSDVNWHCDTKGELQNDKHHPVVHVSWNDASAYCQWLSKKLNKNFRLPTEAEWEYACRAGTTTPFNTGANLTTDQANFDGNYPDKNNPKGKYLGSTTPVGSYPSNGWELYDMHGNVLEWCLDWYSPDYYNEYKRKGIVDNPRGSKTGLHRVLRGGSWRSDARKCRSANRFRGLPSYRNDSVGFRLVFVP